MRDYLNKSAPTHFLFPIDGDCLNDHDGKLVQEGITVSVSVASAPHSVVTVNGISATDEGGIYRADVFCRLGKGTGEDEDPHHHHDVAVGGPAGETLDPFAETARSAHDKGPGAGCHEGNGDGHLVEVAHDD